MMPLQDGLLQDGLLVVLCAASFALLAFGLSSLIEMHWRKGTNARRPEERSGADLSAERLMEQPEITYWAERYEQSGACALGGCSFEEYLQRPHYYERIAAARRDLRRRLNASVRAPARRN
jgi:crotonobetainyl-CoA:carnitine CoA-transferase CaiB-like acyl-CoA transferase